MEITPVKDSRRFGRKEHGFGFVGRLCDRTGKIRLFSGRTRDISLRGLGILIDSSEIPAEGDTVDVSLRIFADEPPIKVVGFVSWCVPGTRGVGERARLGVELTGMVDPIRSYRRWLEILTWS